MSSPVWLSNYKKCLRVHNFLCGVLLLLMANKKLENRIYDPIHSLEKKRT